MKSKQSKEDVISLLTKKAQFSEKLKELSLSKKIKPRQKAARHNVNQKLEIEEKLQTLRNDNAKVADFDIEKIPRFNISKREDL